MDQNAAQAWKAELQAWMAQQINETLQIMVTEPQTEGTYLSKHTTYLVRSLTQGYNVRRRYSDFEWLLQSLSGRYIGLLLPSLPEKKMMKSSDENFIRSRMRSLNIFMDQLTLISFIRNDPAFQAFISDADSWEVTKKNLANQPISPGETKWQDAVSNVTIPENAERIILDVSQQLVPLERLLLALAAAASKISDKSAIYAAEMSEMKASFVAWKEHEEACGDTARVEYPNKDYATMNTVMTHTENMLTSWQEILSFQPSMNELLLYENVKYQYGQVLQMKTMFGEREALKAAHMASVKRKEKLEIEQQSAAARGKADKVATLERSIQEAKQNVDHCLEAYEMMTKGMFFTELDRYNMDKNLHLRDMMGQLSAAHFQYAKRLGMMWQGYIGALEVDPAQMMEKSRVVFAQAAKADASVQGVDGEGAE